MIILIAWIVHLFLTTIGMISPVHDAIDSAIGAVSKSIWQIAPWTPDEIIIAVGSIAGLISVYSVFEGRKIGKQDKERLEKRVRHYFWAGIAVICAATLAATIPIPESWLPGDAAQWKFYLTDVLIAAGSFLLALFSGNHVAELVFD